jgi:hypothetical protein
VNVYILENPQNKEIEWITNCFFFIWYLFSNVLDVLPVTAQQSELLPTLVAIPENYIFYILFINSHSKTFTDTSYTHIHL